MAERGRQTMHFGREAGGLRIPDGERAYAVVLRTENPSSCYNSGFQIN